MGPAEASLRMFAIFRDLSIACDARPSDPNADFNVFLGRLERRHHCPLDKGLQPSGKRLSAFRPSSVEFVLQRPTDSLTEDPPRLAKTSSVSFLTCGFVERRL